ncbi:2-hydroxyacid dehydrogenase [Pelobacter seleniigenes]|uniref:2-hydroxyacid dehydrogenase n=1 Tax=Pelobacter seleniigenes TaxID=407188 RepID=UPI0004A6BB1D|nr:2-hydroxyacid dehydrogenase [Pelobacter seleniigenes]
MKFHILQTAKLSPKLDAELENEFYVHRQWEQDCIEKYLSEHGDKIQGVATCAPVGVSVELMKMLPNLKVISSRGVGLEKIDFDAARTKGIQVGGTPGVLTDCVADLGLALLLDVSRQVSAADRYVRKGLWLEKKYPMTASVSGKKLGIVGLGQIGRAVASRAAGFNLTIHYTDRQFLADVPYGFEASVVELARWADFLIVTVSGGPATHHMISAEVINALGPKGFLINISRGTVIDQDALVNALINGDIGGAGLDVFNDEPETPQELWALDNVVLTPHMASGTAETREKMEDLVFENLTTFFATGKVKTPAF